jgi:hypothetical protein
MIVENDEKKWRLQAAGGRHIPPVFALSEAMLDSQTKVGVGRIAAKERWVPLI